MSQENTIKKTHIEDVFNKIIEKERGVIEIKKMMYHLDYDRSEEMIDYILNEQIENYELYFDKPVQLLVNVLVEEDYFKEKLIKVLEKQKIIFQHINTLFVNKNTKEKNMSNQDYISKEIEEIITKEIFEKYFKNLKIEGEDYKLNKMTLDLFKIILRLIKLYQASYILSDLQKLKLDIEKLKSENSLSKNEIQFTESFFKILDIKSESLRKEGFTYMIWKLFSWFYNEQPNIYQKILALEEKEMLNDMIKNF